MLERSQEEWFAATPGEKAAAETLARSYLISELEQNLISSDEAARIIDARMTERDEAWSRAVYGMLVGLRRVGIAAASVPQTTHREATRSVPAASGPSSSDCTLHDEFLHDARAGVADLR